MSERRYTMSSAPRARHCIYWLRPEVPHEKQKSGPAARLGSAFHELAETFVSLGGFDNGPKYLELSGKYDLTKAQIVELSKLYDSWLSWWRDFHRDLMWLPEVPYAINHETGQARPVMLGPGGQRDYQCKEAEVPGTCDLVLVPEDGGPVVVIDYKTGKLPQEPAETHAQIRALGAAVAKSHSRKGARVALAMVSTKGVVLDQAEMLEEDIENAVSEIQMQHMAAPYAQPVTGDWCRWCPAKKACPAWQEGWT